MLYIVVIIDSIYTSLLALGEPVVGFVALAPFFGASGPPEEPGLPLPERRKYVPVGSRPASLRPDVRLREARYLWLVLWRLDVRSFFFGGRCGKVFASILDGG